jgi:subtilase family serine protease
LKPEEFADRFGVSQGDIDKVTIWMRSEGFDIISVGRGRRYVAFNATAQQIASTLKTEIHHYRVNGELHFANASEPSVPAAIQPLALSFMGLDDFEPRAQAKAEAHG